MPFSALPRNYRAAVVIAPGLKAQAGFKVRTVNPIIQREFVGTLRSRRAFLVQVLLVAALATLVIVRWPSEGRMDLSGAAAQQVLRIFGYGLMTALILITPVFPATSIVREAQQRTLELLLNSPMRRWSIVIGKLIGVLGFILLLLVLSIPAAAACYAMGGVDLYQQLGRMYLVLFVLALMYSTLGFLISTYARSSDSALRLTFGVILLLAVVTLGPFAFLQGQPWLSPGGEQVIDWIRCISPISAMMDVLGDTGIGSDLAVISNPALRFVMIASISSLVFLFWSMARCSYALMDRARSSGKVTDDRSTGVRVYRRIMYLWFFDPQRRSGLIGPLTNPVTVKEQRTRRLGRGHWMMRLIGACLVVSLLLMLVAANQSDEHGTSGMGAIMVVLQMSLIILLTPSLASGLISTERESGGWQLLQMTPLSAVTILFGKLKSVALTLGLVILATLPAYLVLIYIDSGMTWVALQVVTTLVLTAVMSLLVSAVISSVCRQTASATATAYAVLIVLCAGTMLFWLGQDAPFAPQLVERVLMLNPLAAALELIEARGFREYDLVPANWWFLGGVSITALVLLVGQTWRLTRPQ